MYKFNKRTKLMKNLLSLTLILISLTSKAQDFRKTNWGMSQAQVKATETTPIIKETPEILAYKTTLADFDTYVIYIFAGNKLTRTKYNLIEPHSNKNDYISDYNTLKGLLEKKYGNSVEDEKIWKNDLYKDDYSDWGFAVSLGHLVYYAKWESEKADIILMLSGENYDIETVVEYSSKELGSVEDELRTQNSLDNFSLFGFRNNSWGDNKNSVKAKENLELLQEDSELIAYTGQITGMDMIIGYLFANDKLTTGKYLVIEDHSNKNDYISDFNSLKKLLDKKYGSPKKDETLWKNDLYRDDFSEWGFAVSLGHLIYYATYENEKSEITIMLSGENYDIQLLIEASSKDLKEYMKKTNEKKALDDF